MIERTLDHIGIAVASIDHALPIWSALSRGAVHGRQFVPEQQVEIVFLGTGPGKIELLAPTEPNSPVARFLERRGPGLHHLCYSVADLPAALAEHIAGGFDPIDRVPRRGAGGHLIAFLHPRTAGGVLVELLQAD